jgi:hypothetical protein
MQANNIFLSKLMQETNDTEKYEYLPKGIFGEARLPPMNQMYIPHSGVVDSIGYDAHLNRMLFSISSKPRELPTMPSILNPIVPNFVAAPNEPGEFLISRDININWPQIKLKKLRLVKGIASQRRRLQISLMVSMPDKENPECLGVCYSKAFVVRSHQNQLSQNVKHQRKKLVNEKTPRKNKIVPLPRLTAEGMMRESSNFFVSNVGVEQIQDRNLMGEVEEEGRYPIVHIDGDFFKNVVRLLPSSSKVWMDMKLVIPKEGQLSSCKYNVAPRICKYEDM